MVATAKATAYTIHMLDADHHRDQQHQPGAQDVADDHGHAAIPSVHQGARQRTQQHVRRGGHGQRDAQVQRRAQLDQQHAQRHLVDAVAEEADQLAGPQQREVAVADEGQVGGLRALGTDRRRAHRGGRRGDHQGWRRQRRRGLARRPRCSTARAAGNGSPRRGGSVESDALRRLRARHGVDDGPEDAHRQQDVADADHVPDEGNGQRHHVAEDAALRHELGHACRTRSGSGTGRRRARPARSRRPRRRWTRWASARR